MRPFTRLPPGDREHDPNRSAVRQHRRSAVAQKRRHHTGQRNEPEQSAGDDETLNAQHEHDADDEKRREVARRSRGNTQASPADKCVEHGNCGEPDPAELFAERGQHEIGVALRDRRRTAKACPAAPDAAGRERPEAVRDMIAAAHTVLKRVQRRVV